MHSPKIGLNLNTPESTRSAYSSNHFSASKIHKRYQRDLHSVRTWLRVDLGASAPRQEFPLLDLFLQSSEQFVWSNSSSFTSQFHFYYYYCYFLLELKTIDLAGHFSCLWVNDGLPECTFIDSTCKLHNNREGFRHQTVSISVWNIYC